MSEKTKMPEGANLPAKNDAANLPIPNNTIALTAMQPQNSTASPAEPDETAVRQRPAAVLQENTPSPAPSGTSCNIFYNNKNGKETEKSEDVKNTSDKENFSPKNVPDVPDVPDVGNMPAQRLQDACVSVAGRQALPYVAKIGGKIRIGHLRSPRDNWEILTDVALPDLLGGERPVDTAIEAAQSDAFHVVDADTHHLSSKPSLAELEAHAAAVTPIPDAWWASHGSGLKLFYCGLQAESRALAAALSLPAFFTIELLQHTRHPGADRSDMPGAKCGSIHFSGEQPTLGFDFLGSGKLSPEDMAAALEKLGLEAGRRYDHDRCPIDPGADSSAKECVVVLDGGVYCHRCAGKGISPSGGGAPGFLSFRAVLGNSVDSALDDLTKNLVHWTHAKYHLRHIYPHISERLLQRIYRLAIELRYETDPRVAGVFNPDLDFVRLAGAWAEDKVFTLTKVDQDAANSLPYCQYVVTEKNKKGEEKAKISVDPARRSRAINRSPEGYLPLHPYRGIRFAEGNDYIPVLVEPRPKHEIRLLGDDEIMPEHEAQAVLQTAFPRLDPGYLKACVCMAICGEMGSGQPPMLCASGPSGSGKTETIRLAASLLGDQIHKVNMLPETGAFMRQIGAALAGGARFLVFDEFGKTPGLSKFLPDILQLGRVVEWRRLYSNGLISTPCNAAFFFPCVTFPEFITQSAEFRRRTRHLRLNYRSPNWAVTSGGDTAEWRDRTPENAYVGNSILTYCWRLCHDYEFCF